MKKLYVIVRNDLSRSQKTVQAVHAAAEYLLYDDTLGWDNGTVVCLKAKNEVHLNILEERIYDMGLSCKSFLEPDIGNQKTALALVGDCGIFKDLPLL